MRLSLQNELLRFCFVSLMTVWQSAASTMAVAGIGAAVPGSDGRCPSDAAHRYPHTDRRLGIGQHVKEGRSAIPPRVRI